jgi:hypothetical protein
MVGSAMTPLVPKVSVIVPAVVPEDIMAIAVQFVPSVLYSHCCEVNPTDVRWVA